MKPRERILSAFRFEQPDDMVPAWELEFHLYQELLGRSPIIGYEFARLTPKEKERACYGNVELMIEAAERTGHCAFYCFPDYWEVGPGVPAALWLPERDDQLLLIRALRDLAGGEYLILGPGGSVPGVPSGEDLAEYCYYLYDHLDEAAERAARAMREYCEWGRRVIDAGAEGVVMCSDVAFNKGPFLPAALVERLITPNVRFWVETFRALGAHTIWHSDGDMTSLMPMIAEAGVTALQAIDPIAGMDIVALKQQYQGRLTLIGNLNCLTLQFGPPEKIDRECRHIIEGCKAGGGYVFGCSNAVFRGIPIEHYLVAVEALKKYGRYDAESEPQLHAAADA